MYVNAPGLQPIRLPEAPPPAAVVPVAGGGSPDDAPESVPGAAAAADAGGVDPSDDIAELSAKRPLGTLDVATEVFLVSGDGGVAVGRVRAQDREIRMRDPNTGHLRSVTNLVEATLTALPSDLGAPWVDAQGRLLALQAATGLAHAVPEDRARAKAHGLTLRPYPTASRAIPVSVVREVLPRLLSRRYVRRIDLGIETRAATEAVRAHFCDDHGCFEVLAVDEDGPGGRAGLQPRDLIVSIQGERLRPTAGLRDLLLPFQPGETIQLGIVRKGQRERVDVKLAGAR
jgi:serine protease DegS